MQVAINPRYVPFRSATRFHGRLVLARYEHPLVFFAVLTLFAIFSIMTLLGILQPAHAWPWDDLMNAINPTNWPNNLYNAGCDFLKSSSGSKLTQNFQSLLGDNSKAYKAAETINQTAIKPLAMSILAIVFLIGCFDVANKFEQNGAIAPVKEIIFLLIGAAICVTVVKQSLSYCESIFNVFAGISDTVLNRSGLQQMGADSFQTDTAENVFKAVTDWCPKMSLAFLFFLACILINIVTYFSVLGRAVQALIYAMLSPIAIAFFGNDHTRPWAIGFVKSYIALAMSGVLMAAMLILLPLAWSEITASNGGLLMMIAVAAVFIKGMASCGAWAKELLGA